MNDRLSVAELQQRWERALAATSKAVCAHPELYGKIKSTSEKIVGEPLDISQYFPMVEKLTVSFAPWTPAAAAFFIFSSVGFRPRRSGRSGCCAWSARTCWLTCRPLNSGAEHHTGLESSNKLSLPWLSCRSAAFFPQPGHHRLETMEVDIALDLVKGRRYRMF
jgi:hypothetical protein